MVKLGPDLNGGDSAKSGYLPSGKITGFSMMHESGTGGAPKYGVVSQLPLAGTIANPLVDVSVSRSAPDTGSVGYYKSSLSNGIIAELAATPHVGFFQYTFPPGQAANVLVDVSHYLPSNRNQNFAQVYTKGDLQNFPDGHYEGSGTYHGGWNLSA
jgi:putative alpha-1,2-mannosidase